MNLKTLLPYFLIVAGFVFGYLIGPKPDPEVENKYHQERILQQQMIDQKNAEIERLTRSGEAIREKAVLDSIRFAGALKAKDISIQKLKNKVDAVSFENFKSADLDSVRLLILGSR